LRMYFVQFSFRHSRSCKQVTLSMKQLITQLH